MDAQRAAETIKLLAELVSEQGGALRMLEAVALGLLDELATDPRVSGAVVLRLEEAYSQSLARSSNAIEHEELDALRNRLLEAMNAAALRGASEAGGGGG